MVCVRLLQVHAKPIIHIIKDLRPNTCINDSITHLQLSFIVMVCLFADLWLLDTRWDGEEHINQLLNVSTHSD